MAMQEKSQLFKRVRIALLLVLGSGALYLLILNRQHDPRFYRFLGSAPGQFLDRVFNWSGDDAGLLDLADSEMSELEQSVKQQLERQIRQEWAPDIVRKISGEEIRGEIVGESSTHVTIKQRFGNSGGMQFNIKRDEIVSIERGVSDENPKVTYRDVKFQMEFPEMQLYRRPPYSILTSEKFLDVEDAVRTLENLHEDFMDNFGEIIFSENRGKSIQLLFFGGEEEFTRYRREHAPNLGYSAGFYSPQADRLVVFDQKESIQIRELESELDQTYQQHRSADKALRHDQSIRNWYERQKRNLSQMAESENFRILRHEGAHQLFYTYGLHSAHHAENLWLIEGLAVYCETDPVGRTLAASRDLLLAAEQSQRLIAMTALINYRSPQGFGRLVRDGEIDIAYAQSWGLVFYLMQPERRVKFLQYIEYVRDPENTTAVAKADRLELLCQITGEDPDTLLDNILELLRRR